MKSYYRPLVQTDPSRTTQALGLAGGWCWFDHAERIQRGGSREIVPAAAIPADVVYMLCAPRDSVLGLSMTAPRLMGILNVTPDSFSDGGLFRAHGDALTHANLMIMAGADIIDIGGESTRPGATPVDPQQEIDRILPVISALRHQSTIPISADTRKATVAQAALDAGASMINDVSALEFDSDLPEVAARSNRPICLMHSRGNPQTMQQHPVYDDVVLDVYDHLQARIRVALTAGIDRRNIIVDPGIGFGKTLEHNLALLQNLSLFHGLGFPVLLGVSRKKFIGTLGDAPLASARTPGSIALTLAGVAQGVQIHRVHDVNETRQALTLWAAATGTEQ